MVGMEETQLIMLAFWWSTIPFYFACAWMWQCILFNACEFSFDKEVLQLLQWHIFSFCFSSFTAGMVHGIRKRFIEGLDSLCKPGPLNLIFRSAFGKTKQLVQFGKRLSLCRKFKIQTQKRFSGCGNVRRFNSKLNRRGFGLLVFLLSGYGAQSMDAQQFGQFMDAMNTIVQRQNVVAESTANLVATIPNLLQQATQTSAISSSSTSSNLARNLESAAKILKAPEIFDSTDSAMWINWHHSFLNWLSYSDNRFVNFIRDIDNLEPHVELDAVDWSDDDWDLARKLYAILTSYLKGSSLQLSRSQAEERNGFKLWKMLTDHFAPATRQRALALSQAISKFPPFSNDKSLQEQLSSLETLVQEYDVLRAKPFDREVFLLGVLLRICPESIRQHLTFAFSEGTSYQDVCEKILAYERSSKAWTMNDVMKQVNASSGKQNSLPSVGVDTGPAPMEIDNVVWKGKGKEKGKKGKGKGGWNGWSTFWSNVNSWQKGFKGKGEKGTSKGKFKGKSKGKYGKNGQSKGKGKKGSDGCRICGQMGHWGNECPNRGSAMVNEVRQSENFRVQEAQQQQEQVRAAVPGSAYSFVGSTTASTTGRSVRRVHMYHVGTPPTTFPEEFNMSEASNVESLGSFRACAVAVVGQQEVPLNVFELFDLDDRVLDAEQLVDDPFYEWLCNEAESPGEEVAEKEFHV